MKSIFIIAALFIVGASFTFAQWTEQFYINDVCFRSVYMVNENEGIAVGSNCSISGMIYGTSNGGNDWYYINRPGGSCPALWSVWFSTPNIGFAVGSDGTIIKSTNGGYSWEYSTSNTTKLLTSVFFIDSNTGWAAGGHNVDGVVILKTIDQGVTWEEKPCSEIGTLGEIFFINSDVGWAIGREGGPGPNYISRSIIIKTTDGGESWTSIDSGVDDCWLYSVYFLNQNLGWIVGTRDRHNPIEPKLVLLKTTDSGNSWNSQINNEEGEFYSLRMCDTNIGWAVGKGDIWGNTFGLNYETTDGGNSWIHRTSLNNVMMNGMHFVNPSLGWGTSFENRIYKYDRGTDVNEISSFPHQYSLSQNFPNPFNPSSTIKYEIPELSFVTLYIYDVLGNEIKTLFSGEKSAGHFEVEFDASSLPSGIYFYRLQAVPTGRQAGSFVETKKMVLLR